MVECSTEPLCRRFFEIAQDTVRSARINVRVFRSDLMRTPPAFLIANQPGALFGR
jgi:hypothetical protein